MIAAGGIGSGAAMLAAMVLGAEGVQIGSAFAVAEESSAHQHFKEKILAAQEGDTQLRMKSLIPVRLLHNPFAAAVAKAESEGASKTQLMDLLGRARAKIGMFDGDLEEGELEIGQVSASLTKIAPAAEILQQIWQEFVLEKERIIKL